MATRQRMSSVIKDGDISVFDLRDIILKLPTAQPITDAFEAGATDNVSYSSQQEHLAGWLEEYNGPGAYNRANPTTSSKHFYNHFRCAAGLVWLAEALGEDKATLNAAVDAIRGAGSNPSSQCAAFRRTVPWPRILELIEQQPDEILRGITGPYKLRRLAVGLGSRLSSSLGQRLSKAEFDI
ncbi:hypothetical protein [Gordonia paraffinivorans]|uniref:hypothetical protein n=1 Tax=Gordonia paraffinivorans TaxID=175628 RepID=UPI0011B1CA1A|nr:hypothetical protein [Gordonia paraffinivorans]